MNARSSQPRSFTVYVDDNFHNMDENERCTAGTFSSYEAALSLAKGIVERGLKNYLADGRPAADWLGHYMDFGEDPWIKPTSEGVPRFSAWKYAEELAAQPIGP
jgi:hypothetical protein